MMKMRMRMRKGMMVTTMMMMIMKRKMKMKKNVGNSESSWSHAKVENHMVISFAIKEKIAGLFHGMKL